MTTDTAHTPECDDTGDACAAHGEPQAVEKTAPMTAEQIKARLEEIAPYPVMGTRHLGEAVARWLTVQALRRWRRTMDFPGADDAAGKQLHMMTMSAMLSDFAAVHALMKLAATSRIGVSAGREIWDAWEDGQRVGEWLWEHAEALGLDPAEPGRLEEALQALAEQPSPAPQSPADASQRIALDIARSALSRLAAGIPVADDEAGEFDARRRAAERALGDVALTLGEER